MFDKTTIDVESLVTPNVRMQLLQHLRSQLGYPALTVADIKSLEAIDFKLTAFATVYQFKVVVVKETGGTAKSSVLDLGNVTAVPTKLVETVLYGLIAEILEPGDQFPRFEAEFRKDYIPVNATASIQS